MIEDTTTLDMAPLDQILEDYADQKGAIIPILQHVQEIYGYLPKEILPEISRRTNIPVSRLIGVATFFSCLTPPSAISIVVRPRRKW